MPWYLYNPIDPFPHNSSDPNNYNNVGITPPNCPNPNNFLCSIQAADNAGKPIITLALESEKNNAVNNKTETTNVRLRPTLYP